MSRITDLQEELRHREHHISDLDKEVQHLHENISALTKELEFKGKEILRIRSESNQQMRYAIDYRLKIGSRIARDGWLVRIKNIYMYNCQQMSKPIRSKLMATA